MDHSAVAEQLQRGKKVPLHITWVIPFEQASDRELRTWMRTAKKQEIVKMLTDFLLENPGIGTWDGRVEYDMMPNEYYYQFLYSAWLRPVFPPKV